MNRIIHVYDASSRITCCVREDGTTVYYGYDRASRLTSEDWYDSGMSSVYAFAWDYDSAGNRTYQGFNGVETYYTYNADNSLDYHYTGDDYSYFEYDSRGNCTVIQESDGSVYFEYNHADLVTRISYKNGTENYFYYDSKLRRYAMIDSGGLIYFSYGGCGLRTFVERDAAGAVTSEYVHGYSPVNGIGTMVAARKVAGGVNYYQYPVYDHRGTVVRLVDENANVVAYYEYSAWGQHLQEQESYPNVENRFRYHSNWLSLNDSGGKLALSPSRIYSMALARFLQKDPHQIGLYPNSYFGKKSRKTRDTNLYTYVKNNPLTLLDPYGLFEIEWEDTTVGFGVEYKPGIGPIVVPQILTWTEKEKQKVLSSMRNVRRRCDWLTKEIDKYLEEVLEKCPDRYKELIENFKRLRKLIEKVKVLIDSPTHNLEIYKDYGERGKPAYVVMNPTGLIDDELHLNINPNTNWSKSSNKDNTMFHEILHLAGAEHNKDEWSDPDITQDLEWISKISNYHPAMWEKFQADRK